MQEETLDLRDYVDMLLRKWWLLLIGPALGVMLALVFGFAAGEATSDSTEASAYQATALVLMDGTGGRAIPLTWSTSDQFWKELSIEQTCPYLWQNSVPESLPGAWRALT